MDVVHQLRRVARRLLRGPSGPVPQQPEPEPEPEPEPPATFEYLGYTIPVDLAMRTGGGPETFLAIANGHQHLLQTWIGVSESDRVLEIGCGVGRDAIPLTRLLTSGSYVGVDVIKPSISWLQDNVACDHDNFSFIHLDVDDELHNPDGKDRMTDLQLPLEDGSIDRIFLFSVFTHLFRDEVEHYLREFQRVLSPGGMVYASAFVVDDAVLASARDTDLTQWHLRFEHEMEPGVLINDEASPRGAVAYTDSTFGDMLRESGLDVVNQLQGSWSGYYEEPHEGQDAVVLRQPVP